jgi:hypothetical protein
MPSGKGAKRSQKQVKSSSKSKPATRSAQQRQHVLSRTKALKRIQQLLSEGNVLPEEAIELVSMFHFQVDELTEAGVPYEMVRALETRYPFLSM